jgi:hypothetical protein
LLDTGDDDGDDDDDAVASAPLPSSADVDAFDESALPSYLQSSTDLGELCVLPAKLVLHVQLPDATSKALPARIDVPVSQLLAATARKLGLRSADGFEFYSVDLGTWLDADLSLAEQGVGVVTSLLPLAAAEGGTFADSGAVGNHALNSELASSSTLSSTMPLDVAPGGASSATTTATGGGDAIATARVVLLRRYLLSDVLFASHAADPVALALIFAQTSGLVLRGALALPPAVLVKLAALKMRVLYGDYVARTHRTGFLAGKLLSEFLPPPVDRGLELAIYSAFSMMNGVSKPAAMSEYVRLCRAPDVSLAHDLLRLFSFEYTAELRKRGALQSGVKEERACVWCVVCVRARPLITRTA